MNRASVKFLLDAFLSVMLTVAVCASAWVFVRGQLAGSSAIDTALADVPNWQADTVGALRIGSADAPVTVMEFIDFQCPYCRRLAERMDTMRSEFGDRITTVVHHYPLPMHEFAVPAAIAAECAAEQEAFAEFYNALFEDQGGLGQKAWLDYARTAHVSDLEQFERCLQMPPEYFQRLGLGQEVGTRIGVRGTPTIIVNGSRMNGAPSLETLRNEILNALNVTGASR